MLEVLFVSLQVGPICNYSKYVMNKLQKHVYKLNEQLCTAYFSFSSPFYFHAEPWINSIISKRNNKFDTTESIPRTQAPTRGAHGSVNQT